MHFAIVEGFVKAATVGQMGWLYLMAAMYISGAALYAARVPERYFPGRCDIWVRLWMIYLLEKLIAAECEKQPCFSVFLSFSLIRYFTCWLSVQHLSISTESQTCRSFVTVWKEAARMTLCCKK